MSQPRFTRDELESESKFLADLVLKNLRYQQNWTNLKTHDIELPHPSQTSTFKFTIVSGTPPEKLHHEDLVISETELYTEWILPSVTEQEWSIREWAQVFEQTGKVAEQESKYNSTIQPSVRRIVMACQTNDGTVVYYMINKGIIPPRRN